MAFSSSQQLPRASTNSPQLMMDCNYSAWLKIVYNISRIDRPGMQCPRLRTNFSSTCCYAKFLCRRRTVRYLASAVKRVRLIRRCDLRYSNVICLDFKLKSILATKCIHNISSIVSIEVRLFASIILQVTIWPALFVTSLLKCLWFIQENFHYPISARSMFIMHGAASCSGKMFIRWLFKPSHYCLLSVCKVQ